jgi:hypothetical protein
MPRFLRVLALVVAALFAVLATLQLAYGSGLQPPGKDEVRVAFASQPGFPRLKE